MIVNEIIALVFLFECISVFKPSLRRHSSFTQLKPQIAPLYDVMNALRSYHSKNGTNVEQRYPLMETCREYVP